MLRRAIIFLVLCVGLTVAAVPASADPIACPSGSNAGSEQRRVPDHRNDARRWRLERRWRQWWWQD